ncbi:MAG: response regulator, partial [Proteobacteria bacterium]|nr:response regulator [Pseudomonadota bacterium]
CREDQTVGPLRNTPLENATQPVATCDKKLRAKLLLVEDNQVNQRVALRLVEKLGYEVEVASDGQEAVERIKRAPREYALILMDCQMPVMDGFSATEAIRSYERGLGFHIPIVAMTASAMESDERRCLAAGMDGFIAKPIDLPLLRSTLAKFLDHLQRASSGDETRGER